MTTSKGGRPLKFKTVAELQGKIDAYFKTIGWKTRNIENKKTGKIEKVSMYEPATITGLALALNTNRTTLLEYEGEIEGREKNDPEYANTIKEAKAFCEHSLEQGALSGNLSAPVSIFSLKNNYNWVDKTEVVVDKKLIDVDQ